jgi:mRNA-degrading endonuclease RelE of RelBE toxin-antitoxin system
MPEQAAEILLADQVVAFVRDLAPDPRRRLRLALRDLARDLGDILPLEGALSGYERLRVGAFRVIFRRAAKASGRPRIYCVFVERRSLVYVLLEDLLTRGLLKPRE